MKTIHAARGKWRGILLTLGLSQEAVSGKHTACPLCGGVDRFRFTNREGQGGYICNQCGHGDGMDLIRKLHGWDWKTACDEVDKVVHNCRPDAIHKPMDDDKRRQMLNDLWRASVPIRGTLAEAYLAGRGLVAHCPDLRFVERCRHPDGDYYPAMIAMVRDKDGKPCQLHRTYLDGADKADTDTQRALMPGPLPDGACVRLCEATDVIGVAEGIETALAATLQFMVPVWAAINSTNLAKWTPPAGKRVMIFGDNDPKFGGQAAAYALAHRLAVQKHDVQVFIPDDTGKDWADEKTS